MGGLAGLDHIVLGAAAGTGIAAAVISSGRFADLKADQLTISPVSLALTIALGTLVTLIAVLRPARKAIRISPLVALTGQVASTKQAGRRRMWVAVAGVIIAVIGAAVVALGIQASDIYITASGSAVVVVGTVLSLPLLVTAITVPVTVVLLARAALFRRRAARGGPPPPPSRRHPALGCQRPGRRCPASGRCR